VSRKLESRRKNEHGSECRVEVQPCQDEEGGAGAGSSGCPVEHHASADEVGKVMLGECAREESCGVPAECAC